jgi:predicted glycosyltransferase
LNVLVDINHPAHVHLFKHVIDELEQGGHDVSVTSREKEITTDLLDYYEIEHISLSSVGNSLFGLAAEFAIKDLMLFNHARSVDPDVYVGCNPAIAHISAVLGGRCIMLHDSEPTPVREYLFRPFADAILTPEGFDNELGSKQVRYPGYHELAYLHPDRFSPNPDLLREHGVDPDEEFYVVRFIAWGAHHDAGEAGLSPEAQRELVSTLEETGTVYITTEDELPEYFEEYRLPVPPHLIHDLLNYADLYIGDSQTMATEAAVLGTPSIRSNSFAGDNDMSNFVELEEEYSLLYSTPDEGDAIRKARELLADIDLEETWQRRRERMLEEKTDVTSVIIDTLEEGDTA